MDKRGLELAIGTLIIIILAILVLVAILVIWNYQTGIFSDFLRNLQGKTNVDSLVTACNSLVTQNSVYNYCCVKKDVRYQENEKILKDKLTCQELSEKQFTGDRIEKLNCEDAGC